MRKEQGLRAFGEQLKKGRSGEVCEKRAAAGDDRVGHKRTEGPNYVSVRTTSFIYMLEYAILTSFSSLAQLAAEKLQSGKKTGETKLYLSSVIKNTIKYMNDIKL